MDHYTTVQGDTWDLISFKIYGDEKYADVLMSNNYPYLDIFVFPAGVELNVPEIVDEDNDFEVPEWRDDEGSDEF